MSSLRRAENSNVLNELLCTRLAETPPRRVVGLMRMFTSTEKGKRLALILLESTALGAVPDDTVLHRIRRMEVKSDMNNHPRIRLKPDATTYQNLITGIALEQNDLDTGALLLREMISVGLMIKSRILRLLIRASLRKAKDETIDEAKNIGVELAVGFLPVMCDARTTPKEALEQISPSDFDGVLGPRVYEGHGGRVLAGGQPSFLVFREFLEGAQGVRRLTGRDCGAIVLRLMRENGVEVDEGTRKLANMLDHPCLTSPSLIWPAYILHTAKKAVSFRELGPLLFLWNTSKCAARE